jgi:hypothetical protein
MTSPLERTPLRGRLATYTFVLGSAVGLLGASLAVPLVFGHTPKTTQLSADPGALSSATGAPQADVPSPAPSGPTPTAVAVPQGALPVVVGGAAPPAAGGPAIVSSTPRTDTLGSGGGPAGKPRAGRTASDRGITANTVKLGIELVDFGGANQLGANVQKGYDPKAQQKFYDTFIKAANASGGAFGRTIVPVYYTVDILDQNTMRQACKSLIEDSKVFAVTNVLGVYGDPILCVTKDHQTPFLAVDGAISSYYQQSGGRLFTVGAATFATAANMVDALVSAGELKGHKIGLLNEADYLAPDFNKVFEHMKALGLDAYHEEISAVDTAQASRDIPVAINNLHSHGVDYVLLMTNSLYAQEFVQDAKPNPFPNYAESDFDYETAGDSFLKNLDSSYFHHAVAVTASRVGDARVGIPAPPLDRTCRSTYERGTGTTLDPTSDDYYNAIAACDLIKLFVDGMGKAGDNPTRTTFVGGLASLGSIPLAGVGAASFGNGKYASPDAVRILRADGSCACWKPTGNGGFSPARYRD